MCKPAIAAERASLARPCCRRGRAAGSRRAERGRAASAPAAAGASAEPASASKPSQSDVAGAVEAMEDGDFEMLRDLQPAEAKRKLAELLANTGKKTRVS